MGRVGGGVGGVWGLWLLWLLWTDGRLMCCLLVVAREGLSLRLLLGRKSGVATCSLPVCLESDWETGWLS